MCKNCAIAVGATAVICLGVAMWMYQSKWYREREFLQGKSDDLKTPEDKVLDNLVTPPAESGRVRLATSIPLSSQDPPAMQQPYGCGSFMKDCVQGDVGGCQQYKQTCASADNSVRLSMDRPGECDQFRRQCAMGEYASCDLYNRACLYENNN